MTCVEQAERLVATGRPPRRPGRRRTPTKLFVSSAGLERARGSDAPPRPWPGRISPGEQRHDVARPTTSLAGGQALGLEQVAELVEGRPRCARTGPRRWCRGSVALTVRMKSAGRPWARLVGGEGLEGLDRIDPTEVEAGRRDQHRIVRSASETARCERRRRDGSRLRRTACLAAVGVEEVGASAPTVGGEPQRLDVDALVVAVEHRAVVLEAEVLR